MVMLSTRLTGSSINMTVVSMCKAWSTGAGAGASVYAKWRARNWRLKSSLTHAGSTASAYSA